MGIERKFYDHDGHHAIEYTVETYTKDDGEEMTRIVVERGKAYIIYMLDYLDGAYDVLYAGEIWEKESKSLVEVTSDGLSAKEYLAMLQDMIDNPRYYQDYFDKYKL